MTQYFDPNPVTPSDRKVIPYRMNGINFEFTTDSSVFSRKEVDFGTNLLIDTLVKDISPEAPRWSVLWTWDAASESSES